MQSKSENPQTAAPSVAQKGGFMDLSPSELYGMAWSASNFTAVAAATSAAIVAIQSPVKTVLVNTAKNGTLIPAYTGGALGFARALYKGTTNSLYGSAARTAYVTTAKNNKPGENFVEEGQVKSKKLSGATTGYVMSIALGDIIITQIPESLSQFQKMPGFLPPNFKWYQPNNAFQLMAGGFTPRYLAGMVNFASMCVLEERIARGLPIDNSKTKHFAAGSLSGASAAFFSYPLSAFKDYTLVKACITNGQLKNKTTFAMLKCVFDELRSDPKQAVKAFGKNAAKQLPIRMALSGLIFSTVAGMGETLGTEPLKAVVPDLHPSSVKLPQRFFSGYKPGTKVDVTEPKKTETEAVQTTSKP